MRTKRLAVIHLSLPMRIAMKWPLFFIALAPLGCHAANFDERVSRAEAILAAKQNESRSKWIHEHVALRVKPLLDHCLLAVENADVTGFILIGDVETSGKVANIDIRPSTNVARCVVHDLESKVFEKPPLNEREGSLPLLLDWVHVL